MKRKIAGLIAAVLIEDGRAKGEDIHVSFDDVPAGNYAEAGVLVVDQNGRAMAFVVALTGAPSEQRPTFDSSISS